MKRKIFIVAAVMISSRLPLQSQEDSTGKVLDEIVLSTNKYPRKQSETGKVVTIINRQQLEKNSGKTIGELLNSVAGTIITGANNNPGTNNTTSIRGASAGNTLILVDGIPYNDPSVNNNYFDLNYFSIEQVDRIEILKGGQSTLYGSDAVAGVINIILKKAGTGKLNFTANLSGGSYSTFKQSVSISGKKNSTDYNLAYTHLGSQGFSTACDTNKTGTFDKDGFDQHVVNLRLGQAVNKKLRIDLFSSYSYYNTDLDASAFTDEKDFAVKNDNVQIGTGLQYDHTRGALRFRYSFNYIEREYYDDSIHKSSPFLDWAKSKYIGRSHYTELYSNWKWNHWELLAGTDFRLNNTDQYYRAQFPPFAPGQPPYIYETSLFDKSMKQFSPYTSAVYKNKGFTGEIGGRLNFHSEYGTNFTYTINPSYLLNNKVKIFANFYSAFKTPTLYQLFDPSAGNAGLMPEKGIIGEAGAEFFHGRLFRLRAVGFYRHTNDAIVYTYNPSTFESRYVNESQQDNYGAELEMSYTAGKLSVAANYTFTDGKTKSAFDGTGTAIGKDTTYYNLYRIPKHAVNLNVGVQATRSLYVSANLRSVSKREEFIYGAASEILKAYATIDLYGEYKFNHKIRVFIDLRNITNQQYFDILGYNSKRFNFMTGLSLNL